MNGNPHPHAPLSNPKVIPPFATYPGGKAADGVIQFLINRVPRHWRYMEPFLGGGAMYLHLKRSEYVHLNDADPKVYAKWGEVSGVNSPYEPNAAKLTNLDFFDWWDANQEYLKTRGTFVFLDPPYLLSTRSQRRKLYGCEFGTVAKHTRLLDHLLSNAPFTTDKAHHSPNIMITHYPCELYSQKLEGAGWIRHDFTGQTRKGRRDECAWTNYKPEDFTLHDYTHIGRDTRQRDNFRRRKRRWLTNLSQMDPREAEAIALEIKAVFLDRV